MNSNENFEADEKQANLGCGRGFGRGRWIKIPFIIAGVILIKSALVLFFWNELIPELFHGPNLTFLQAIEITLLAKLLVSGGGKHFGGRHGGHRGGHFGRHFGEEFGGLHGKFCKPNEAKD